MTTREQAYSALFALISGCYAWSNTPSRRLKLFNDPSIAKNMPAFFQFEGARDKYVYGSGTVSSSQKRQIHAHLFAYVSSSEPKAGGAQQLNAIQDAFDAALTPSGSDAQTGKFTLGGLVDSCRIVDVPLRDPGDIDNIGLLIVDVEMVLP